MAKGDVQVGRKRPQPRAQAVAARVEAFGPMPAPHALEANDATPRRVQPLARGFFHREAMRRSEGAKTRAAVKRGKLRGK